MVNPAGGAPLEFGTLDEAESEAAVALWEEAGLTRPWNDPRADIKLALAGPSSTILTAKADGRLVATVMVGWDGHRGWIYYLAVALPMRRQGLGALMLKAAEDWLKTRGAPKVQLLVRAENAAVLGFYESQGYQRGDAVMMQRVLG